MIKMYKAQQTLLIIVLGFISLHGQLYDDYLGAGHDMGITVQSSSNFGTAQAQNTINGSGLDGRKMAASRFLFQAGFGASMDDIESLAENLDYEAWIDQQMNLPTTLLLPRLWDVNTRSMDLFEMENPGGEYFGPFSVHFQYAWWDQVYKAPDQLRQRVAFALSQIAVISLRSQLGDFGEGLASYYDIMIDNAFGNYEDILQAITIDPNMAFYLTHLNNPKTNNVLGIRPDENFAREIMQLFSVGLYELNNDGSRKVDGMGEWIPTYDNNDIRELAKVFTGLKGGDWSYQALEWVNPDDPIPFGADIYSISREVPLQMDDAEHEQGSKTIIGDHVIPSGQTGMQDIQQAVNHIFNHDNVGPFIARRLIQQLVKSNPSSQYIDRVASVFNDNGSGVRGDLGAVVKSILLDQEARDCFEGDPDHGKLREPVLRYTQLMHSIPTFAADGYYWNNGFDYLDDTKQTPMASPSVFNFFLPDHQPVGDFANDDLFAPEMQIHNSHTGIGYLNQAHKWTQWGVFSWDWHDSTPHIEMDLTSFYQYAGDPESLINQYDILLTHGRLSDETRNTIKNAISQITTDWGDWQWYRSQLALYLILISPDYVVLK